MSEIKNDIGSGHLRVGRPGRQPLVVRNGEDDLEAQIMERLEMLEARPLPEPNLPGPDDRRGPFRFEPRALAALAAIVLSVAGYVIQDARNSSRQDAEIETAKVRLTNLERIAATNTESRIRTEVQLGELREGQAEIKRMLQAHQDETMGLLRRK